MSEELVDAPSLLELVRASVRPVVAYGASPEAPAVKLDANECAWPLGPEERRLVADAISALELHRYPDPTAAALRAAAVARLGGRPEEYLFGVGSDEVIAMLLAVLAEPRDGEVPVTLYPEPTFVMYGITARALGSRPQGVPLAQDWSLDVDAMSDAIARHRPNLVFLATPNNPTSNVFDPSALERLIAADPGALFVLDEAYRWYADAPSPTADLFTRFDNVALLGTLSKIGVAGARIGWCRLPSALAREVDKGRQPYNLSSLAQATGVLAFGPLWDRLLARVERVRAERARLASELAGRARFHVHPADANFLWVRDARDPAALVAHLATAGIRIKSFHERGGRLAHHLRITVGTPEENDALLAALPR